MGSYIAVVSIQQMENLTHYIKIAGYINRQLIVRSSKLHRYSQPLFLTSYERHHTWPSLMMRTLLYTPFCILSVIIIQLVKSNLALALPVVTSLGKRPLTEFITSIRSPIWDGGYCSKMVLSWMSQKTVYK